MRVLGVIPSSTDVLWAIVEGKNSSPILLPNKNTKIKFPKAKNETDNLFDLMKFTKTLIMDKSIEKVCILKAGHNKHGNVSSIRLKTEAVFQLVCAEVSLPVELIYPTTLKANKKKFQEQAGNSPENIFNEGTEFKSKSLKKAVIVAWGGLE